MTIPKNAPELPPDYYLHNFCYVLDFVRQRYADFPDEAARRFEAVFRALSYEAQCLYVRIANRKPIFFLPEELRYAEIADPLAALNELHQNQLIERVMPLAITDELLRAEALDSLTKAQLEQLCAALDKPPPFALKKARKDDLLMYLYSYQGNFQPHVELIWQVSEREVAFWQFLFFGNLEQQNMSQFVIRDLGSARFHAWDEAQLSVLAHSAQEAQEHFAVHWHYRLFKRKVQYGAPPQAVFAWFDALPKPSFSFPIFDKFCLRLGEWLEKNNCPMKHWQYIAIQKSRLHASERYAFCIVAATWKRRWHCAWQSLRIRKQLMSSCLHRILSAAIRKAKAYFAKQ
jgi:hypothetical protein